MNDKINPFSASMKKQSDEWLRQCLINKENFVPEALQAAKLELEERGSDPVEDGAVQNRQAKDIIDKKTVSNLEEATPNVIKQSTPGGSTETVSAHKSAEKVHLSSSRSNKNFDWVNDKSKLDQFRIWLVSTMGLIGTGIAASLIIESSIPFAVVIAIGTAVELHLKTAWYMGSRLVTASEEPVKFRISIIMNIVVLVVIVYLWSNGHEFFRFN